MIRSASRCTAAFAVLASVFTPPPAAAVSTAFTYQGHVVQDGTPVDGLCDFRFSLFTTAEGGSASTQNQIEGIEVESGVFTATIDFGGSFGDGVDRFLEIAVRCPSGAGEYETFAERQALTATPYALYAEKSQWSGLEGLPPELANGLSTGSGLSLSGGQLSIDFEGSGSSGAAAHSDHDHLGQTWQGNDNLVIEGQVANAGALAISNSASNGDGIRIAAADDGVEVVQAGDDGLRVVQAQDDGVRVESTGDDGFDVNDAGGDGLRVGSATDVGVRVVTAPVGVAVENSVTGATITATDLGIDIAVTRVLEEGDESMPTGIRVTSTDVGMLVTDTTRIGVGVEGVGTEQQLATLSGTCTIDAVPDNAGVFVNGVAGYGMVIENIGRTGFSNIDGVGIKIQDVDSIGIEINLFEDDFFSAPPAFLSSAATSGTTSLGAAGMTIFNHDNAGIHVGTMRSNALSAVNTGSDTPTAIFANSSEATGNELSPGLHVRGGPGLSADIILGASDNSEFGDNGSIFSDPDVPTSDLTFFASDDVAFFLEVGSGQDGEFIIRRGLVNTIFRVDASGNVTADGTITGGGADFAEMLPAGETLEPGDVLAIDAAGEMVRSTAPFQTSVIGVYSTKPGFLGGGPDAQGGDRAPLAVVGIVPVKATSEGGAIKPGDRLAASSIAGYAMNAGSDPPVGSLIGKALESLEGDRGTINMLVTLQ
jgi:hypothetical protein